MALLAIALTPGVRSGSAPPTVSLKDVLHLSDPADPPLRVHPALGSSATSLSFLQRKYRQGHDHEVCLGPACSGG